MSDSELLEKAAKAAGFTVVRESEVHKGAVFLYGVQDPWNPLAWDADAFRLAVKLGIGVEPCIHGDDYARAAVGEVLVDEPHNGDPYAATRRAIVRAAAAIGEQTAPLPAPPGEKE